MATLSRDQIDALEDLRRLKLVLDNLPDERLMDGLRGGIPASKRRGVIAGVKAQRAVTPSLRLRSHQ